MSGSKIRLYGSTSGFVELEAPAVADDGTLVLPTAAQGFGKIVQVVHVANTTQFNTTSTTFVDITGHSASITPTDVGNDIIMVSTLVLTARDSPARSGIVKFLRDSTDIGLGVGGVSFAVMTSTVDDFVGFYATTIKDSPGTVSPVTYKAQGRVFAATTTLRTNQREIGGVGYYSSILLVEVAP